MIYKENKELKNQKRQKLCKTHNMKRPRVCRNGKVKLNMMKVVTSRNFRILRKKSYANDVLKRTVAKKI